jgi:Mn-containing catalase
MFFHHKDLAFKVRVDNPNPVFARMLQQAIGGPEGEIRVARQYLFEGWRKTMRRPIRSPARLPSRTNPRSSP